jgi:hypothetical protein
LFVQPPSNRDPVGRHSLAIVDEWEQDGPTIWPEGGETFVKCNLWTRYYGPGYERGDIVSILAIAKWLKKAFAPCEVWYGGDSSGVVAEPIDEKSLWEHFMSDKGRAYFGDQWIEAGGTVHCDFCDLPATENMSGRDKTGYFCNSCGRHWLWYEDGRLVECGKDYQELKENP